MPRIDGSAWWIDVTLDGQGGGALTSHNLKEAGEERLPTNESEVTRVEYNAAIDGLEALILAHACAGVAVEAEAYIKGVRTAVEAIGNQFS